MASAISRRNITASIERWPLARPFVISRGAKTHADVVVVHVEEDGVVGRGEAVPYARYGESVDSVVAAVTRVDPAVSRMILANYLPGGAARNALDCALWDLEGKRLGVRVSELARVADCERVETAFTISLDTAKAMAAQARAAVGLELLKLKLGGGELDHSRMRAVRAARPDARLIADANESWDVEHLAELCQCAFELGFEVIEQPLAANADAALSCVQCAIPICADESVHTRADLDRIVGLYQAVNIKLDKAGGLTEALAMVEAARERGFKIMVGSMVATSLAVAPALLLAHGATWVDLDGPLLLKKDREHGLSIQNGWIAPASSELWG